MDVLGRMDANHDEKVDIQELTEFVRKVPLPSSAACTVNYGSALQEHYAPEEIYDDKEKQEKRVTNDSMQ